MKTLKKILFGLIILIALILIIVIFLPSSVSIEKSIEINKSASTIYKQVNNLKNWEKWSPFQEEYPEMKNEYSEIAEGVGAIMKWSGEESGNGSMLTLIADENKYLECKLDFMEGDTSTLNISKWTFNETNGITKVTWKFESSNLSYPLGKIFGLLMPSMMEKSMNSGLENLKRVSEEISYEPKVKIEEKLTQHFYAYTIYDSAKIQDLGAKLGYIFGEVSKFVEANKLQCTGVPFAIYHNWDMENYIRIEGGIPVSEKTKKKPEQKNIIFKEFPTVKSLQVMHIGSYESSIVPHEEIDKYIEEYKLEKEGNCIEHYITDPSNEPDTSKWQTLIVYPIK